MSVFLLPPSSLSCPFHCVWVYGTLGDVRAPAATRGRTHPLTTLQHAGSKVGMLLWLSWLPATVVATSSDGANVVGGYQNITVSPIFDSCSAVGENCIDSGCCHDPGYTCMHSVKHPKVAMCRRRETPCADTEEWLCPRGYQCTPIFQDCRSTLCCQKAKYLSLIHI